MGEDAFPKDGRNTASLLLHDTEFRGYTIIAAGPADHSGQRTRLAIVEVCEKDGEVHNEVWQCVGSIETHPERDVEPEGGSGWSGAVFLGGKDYTITGNDKPPTENVAPKGYIDCRLVQKHGVDEEDLSF